MILKPMLLDETGQKIKAAIVRVKNKFLGTNSDPITPGAAASSGIAAVIQDDTGREIISALNDLGTAVPADLCDYTNGAIDTKSNGLGVAFGKVAETDDLVESAWDIKAPNIWTGKTKFTLEADASNADNGLEYRDVSGTAGRVMMKYSRSTALDKYLWNNFTFMQMGYNSSTGARTGYRDYFDLPVLPVNNSADAHYDIWTSKTIPKPPATNGTYTLKATVSGGSVTYSWV